MPDQRVRLRGICWDHARCVKPMAAAAAVWRSVRGVEVAWDARPLSAFNDQPVEELAADYDLIVFDHPMVGAAARAGCLAPLDDLLPDSTSATINSTPIPDASSSAPGDCGTVSRWAPTTR